MNQLTLKPIIFLTVFVLMYTNALRHAERYAVVGPPKYGRANHVYVSCLKNGVYFLKDEAVEICGGGAWTCEKVNEGQNTIVCPKDRYLNNDLVNGNCGSTLTGNVGSDSNVLNCLIEFDS